MSIQDNVQIVKSAFAPVGRGDMQGVLALSAAGIEWITPAEWPLAGAYRGHAGVAVLFSEDFRKLRDDREPHRVKASR